MVTPNQHKEVHQKPSVKEDVDSLIKKKKIEKESEGSIAVTEGMAGTQEGVAEVMAGVDRPPKEGVSERKGESGEKGDITGAATSGDDDATMIRAQLMDYDFPSQEIMVRKIRTAINAQIKVEWKNALSFKGGLVTGQAADYNRSIARIRSLTQVLSSLFTATVDMMKGMYVKYFGPDGKRRKLDDL